MKAQRIRLSEKRNIYHRRVSLSAVDISLATMLAKYDNLELQRIWMVVRYKWRGNYQKS